MHKKEVNNVVTSSSSLCIAPTAAAQLQNGTSGRVSDRVRVQLRSETATVTASTQSPRERMFYAGQLSIVCSS
eukprot:646695-Hanusia_phi.AAC.1